MADRWKGLLTRALGGGTEARFHVDAPEAAAGVARAVAGLVRDLAPERQSLLVVCVGTDRSIGDALGPLVGSLLLEQGDQPFGVLGTLDQPVHASNLTDTLAHIDGTYPRPLVLAVDACLGRTESVGSLTVARGPLRPGAGVNKALPPVGEIHLTGGQRRRIHGVLRSAEHPSEPRHAHGKGHRPGIGRWPCWRWAYFRGSGGPPLTTDRAPGWIRKVFGNSPMRSPSACTTTGTGERTVTRLPRANSIFGWPT